MLWGKGANGGPKQQMEGAHVLGPIPLQCSRKEEKKLTMLQGDAEEDRGCNNIVQPANLLSRCLGSPFELRVSGPSTGRLGVLPY